jgi:hypothetical protein
LFESDDCREWELRKAGDRGRGEFKGEEDIRDRNLRSKGRKDGVGLKREVDA